MPHRFLRLLIALWVGSLLTVGFLVAPTLFSVLDVTQAGALAARLFRSEAILAVVCGILSLALANRLVRRADGAYRGLRWLMLVMLLCTLIGYFALEPFMNTWRVAALQAGLTVAQSPYATRFGLLHGLSTSFYVLQSLLGLVVLWRLPLTVRSGY